MLHLRHSGCMFSIKSVPPLHSGIIWSSVSLISGSALLQLGQVWLYCFFNNSQSPKVWDRHLFFNLLIALFLWFLPQLLFSLSLGESFLYLSLWYFARSLVTPPFHIWCFSPFLLSLILFLVSSETFFPFIQVFLPFLAILIFILDSADWCFPSIPLILLVPLTNFPFLSRVISSFSIDYAKPPLLTLVVEAIIFSAGICAPGASCGCPCIGWAGVCWTAGIKVLLSKPKIS